MALLSLSKGRSLPFPVHSTQFRTLLGQHCPDALQYPLGTDSDGQTYRNPKASYEVHKKLSRWQRAQARRQKGSRGWWEAQRKIDKCQRRIRGLRHNAQHQMTSTVTKKYRELVIEDLNVAGMMRGPTLPGPRPTREWGKSSGS